jgi:hypothetical protein
VKLALNGAAKGLRVGVPEIVGFGGEGADAGRDGEGASGGFAAGPNPGGNLGVDGAANDGVAAGPVGVGSNPGGNLGVLAGEGGKLGMGVLALRGGVPSGRDVAGLDGLGALGEGVFCPLPDIVGAWLGLTFVLGGACNLLTHRCCRARQQLLG